MKIVMIGGTGLIGSNVVTRLREHGRQSVPASPDAVCRTAEGAPLNGIREVGGPQQFRFDEFIRLGLAARHDARAVVADPHARYFGAELSERALVPGDDARLGEIRFDDWLAQAVERPASAPSPRPSSDRVATAPSAPG